MGKKLTVIAWPSGTVSFACTSSFRLSLSNRAITRLFSMNQLPVRAASNLSIRGQCQLRMQQEPRDSWVFIRSSRPMPP